MLGFILMPIIVYIEKIVFLERNASKKREIEMKLDIPVHCQMGNPLQEGR
jgi:hypothetical protein